MRPFIDASLSSQWNGGFVMEIFITNQGTQPINDYRVDFTLDGTITDVWDSVVSAQSGDRYTIIDDDSNNDIAPGETVRFKFKVATDSGDMPSTFTVNGVTPGFSPEASTLFQVEESEPAASFPDSYEPAVEEQAPATVDESSQIIHVVAGTSSSEMQELIDTAPEGAVLHLAAGDYRFDTMISISRSDISLVGAGRGETRITFTDEALATGASHGFLVESKATQFAGYLKQNATMGDDTLSLKTDHGLQAGDTVRIWQDNTQEYFNEIGDTTWQQLNAPLRTSMAKVVAVDGGTVTLDRGVHFDFDGGAAKIQRYDALEKVTLQGFTVQYELGSPDNAVFSNTLSELTDYQAIKLNGTVNALVKDIEVLDGPSTAFEFALSLDLAADALGAHGAFNKGTGGNGYAFELRESYDGTLSNLEDSGMRHSVLFASWRSSVGNDVHVLSTDRDINFHGGQDHGNTVHVEQSIRDADADGMSTTLWYNNGGESFGAITEAGANQVTFDYVIGSRRNDILQGSDNGVYMDGALGHDKLYGGAGEDILSGGGGWGDNLLDGGAGFDTALFDLGFDEYKIHFNDDGSVLVDGSSNDTLIDIEQAIFADGTVLDIATRKTTQGEVPSVPTPQEILGTSDNETVITEPAQEPQPEPVETAPEETVIISEPEVVIEPVEPVDAEAMDVDLVVVNRWAGGYVMRVEIANRSSSDVASPEITFTLPAEITTFYGATLLERDGDTYRIAYDGNDTLQADGIMRFSFKAYAPVSEAPASLALNGTELSLFPQTLIVGETADPELLSALDPAPTAADFLALTSNITKTWSGGYMTEVLITNTSDVTIDQPSVSFSLPGTITDMWNGEFLATDAGYVVSAINGGAVLDPGETWRVSYKVRDDSYTLPESLNAEGELIGVPTMQDDGLIGTGGDDTLQGTAVSDALYGSLGADRLTGGAGGDRFVYLSTFESTVFDSDIIVDFGREESDLIDLSNIDADLSSEGEQAFAWVSNAAFSGTAGELRNEGGLVQGDVNGDGIVDLQVDVLGVDSLRAEDFLL